MNDEALQALAAIAKALGLDQCTSGRCDCTTPKGYESSAVRYNDQSAWAFAESQKQFLQHRDLWFGEMLQKIRSST